MKFFVVIVSYLIWHYSRGFAAYLKIWKNLMWFLWNFFSIKILLKTLFSPFERLQEKYGGGFDLENFFSTVVINILMRIIGAFVRIFVIIIGLAALTALFLGGLAGLIVWPLLPFVIGFLIISSIIALVS